MKFFTDKIQSYEQNIMDLKRAMTFVESKGLLEGTAAFHRSHGQVLIQSYGLGPKGKVFAKIITVKGDTVNVHLDGLDAIGSLNQILNQEEK